MQELDMPSSMKVIVSNLPFKLRERWRTTAYDILETHKRRALFKDLVLFIERHVKILSDPLFGDIKDAPTEVLPPLLLLRHQQRRLEMQILTA